MVLLLCSAGFFACSKDKEAEREKGAIEKMTDKTAKEIVDKIQAPIKSARSVKDQQEDRSKKMEKTLKEQ
jgi:predicted transcriptional regulator